MARIYITTMEQGQMRNTKMLVKVCFLYPRFFRCLRCSKSTDTPIARHTTDGADETDFATRLQTAKRNPAKVPPQTTSPHHGTMPLHSATHGKISQPIPAFIHGGDGHHRSDNSLDHPNDRPRAQHTRSRRSSQSNYEMTSDSSYRNGPNAESGRSSS
jgi:aquaporin related protein